MKCCKDIHIRPVSCYLNKFEMAIIHLIFNYFTIFVFHYVSVILKKREPLIKGLFPSFARFKQCCKVSAVIIKFAKIHENGNPWKFAMVVSYE